MAWLQIATVVVANLVVVAVENNTGAKVATATYGHRGDLLAFDAHRDRSRTTPMHTPLRTATAEHHRQQPHHATAAAQTKRQEQQREEQCRKQQHSHNRLMTRVVNSKSSSGNGSSKQQRQHQDQ